MQSCLYFPLRTRGGSFRIIEKGKRLIKAISFRNGVEAWLVNMVEA